MLLQKNQVLSIDKTDKLGEFIGQIFNAKKGAKATIKIEIKFGN